MKNCREVAAYPCDFMSSLRPHRQSSTIGFYGFIILLILAAAVSQKARAKQIEIGMTNDQLISITNQTIK